MFCLQEEDGYEDISSDDELNDAEESEMVQVSCCCLKC